MGNAESAGATANVLSGLKRAQDVRNNKLYALVDYKGRGDISDWMKFALSSGDFNIVDELIEVAHSAVVQFYKPYCGIEE